MKAHGFRPNFSTWWSQRESSSDGAPSDFPGVLPSDPDVVLAIYHDFLQHFRAFESWRLSQRHASLKAKYEGSLSSIYMDLRDEPTASIDHVWQEEKYQILAFDEDTNQLMLDRNIVQQFDSLWFHDGTAISVKAIDGLYVQCIPIMILRPLVR